VNDNGSIVIGWLTKVAVVLSLLGVLSYDGISLVKATFAGEDRANTIASDAADTFRATKDIDKTYLSAAAEAAEQGDTIAPTDFRVDPDGKVTLVLQRTANAVWMQHVGPLKKYLHVRATGTGTPYS
jgi:hypothetical protein